MICWPAGPIYYNLLIVNMPLERIFKSQITVITEVRLRTAKESFKELNNKPALMRSGWDLRPSQWYSMIMDHEWIMNESWMNHEWIMNESWMNQKYQAKSVSQFLFVFCVCPVSAIVRVHLCGFTMFHAEARIQGNPAQSRWLCAQEPSLKQDGHGDQIFFNEKV